MPWTSATRTSGFCCIADARGCELFSRVTSKTPPRNETAVRQTDSSERFRASAGRRPGRRVQRGRPRGHLSGVCRADHGLLRGSAHASNAEPGRGALGDVRLVRHIRRGQIRDTVAALRTLRARPPAQPSEAPCTTPAGGRPARRVHDVGSTARYYGPPRGGDTGHSHQPHDRGRRRSPRPLRGASDECVHRGSRRPATRWTRRLYRRAGMQSRWLVERLGLRVTEQRPG